MADLGTLFVRIEADTANFNRGVDDAKGKTDNLSKSAQGGTKSIAALAAGIGAAFVALRGLSRLISESITLYGRQENAERRLAQSIRDTGGDVEILLREYKDLADEIQNVTTVGDEAALELIQLSRSLGIADDRIEEATKGAIGLSSAFGINAETAIRAVANAFNGNFEQLQRYIPALRTTTDESEKLAIVQQAMANGFELSKAEAQTAFGALQQLGNATGDLKEEFGALVLEGAQPFIEVLTDFVGRVASSTRETRRFREILDALRDNGDAAVGTVSELEDAIARLREQQELVIKTRGEVFSAVDVRRIEEEIRLIEARLAVARQEAIQAGINAGLTRQGAEQALRQQRTLEAVAKARQELEDIRVAALTPAQRELELLQESINLTVRQQEESTIAFGRTAPQTLVLNQLLEAQVQRRRELREEIAGPTVQAVEALDVSFQSLGETGLEVSGILASGLGAVREEIEESERVLSDYEQSLVQFAQVFADSVSPVLEGFGEALVESGDAWVKLGQTAVRAIAQIIRSYAQLWAAEAVGLLFTNPPAAASKATAASLGFVAAGIVNGLANQIQRAALGADFVTSGPQLLMVGDNPGGRERVSVEPLSSPNVNGPDGAPLYVQINLDGQVMSKFVTKAIRNNRILVDARAVV